MDMTFKSNPAKPFANYFFVTNHRISPQFYLISYYLDFLQLLIRIFWDIVFYPNLGSTCPISTKPVGLQPH